MLRKAKFCFLLSYISIQFFISLNGTFSGFDLYETRIKFVDPKFDPSFFIFYMYLFVILTYNMVSNSFQTSSAAHKQMDSVCKS